MFSFQVTCRDPGSQGRVGLLETPHGTMEAPVFMPVGTQGSVKGILPEQLEEIGTQMVLANTYHLMLRPGAEVVAELGGLHRFMGWDGPILTDSGGFQLFSLSGLNRISESEVEFASHIDGAVLKLSPQIATQVQNSLGADIIMAFDECVALPCEPEKMQQAVDRTIRWAQQSLEAHGRRDQWMFGIVQGGTDRSMRQYCVESIRGLDFGGFAIGGLSVGEERESMIETAGFTASLLPEEKPRYLMGVGTPADLVAAIGVGIDMFDCVLPTRNGRNSMAYVRTGRLRLRNQQYRLDDRPLDEKCGCYTCRRFSRGYIRHLFNVNEMAGPMLLTLHNLFFYQWLMAEAREAIRRGCFGDWASQWAGYDAKNEIQVQDSEI